MEKYVLLRGKVIDKWYDFDKKAHYHIIAEVNEKNKKIEQYDISINIGTIIEIKDEFYSSNLQVYYDNNYTYNRKVLKNLLIQKKGITECHKGLNLDYVKMKLFPFEKMIHMKGLDRDNVFLTGIIEKHVFQSIGSENFEIFVFGNLYSNKRGMHDIHMNQGSTGKYRLNDAPFSDGGIFFYDKKKEKWAVIFIAFSNQILNTDERGKALL